MKHAKSTKRRISGNRGAAALAKSGPVKRANPALPSGPGSEFVRSLMGIRPRVLRVEKRLVDGRIVKCKICEPLQDALRRDARKREREKRKRQKGVK